MLLAAVALTPSGYTATTVWSAESAGQARGRYTSLLLQAAVPPMKISRVTAHPLRAPLDRALYTAHEALKDSVAILVEVEASGITGCGVIHGSPLKTICEWVAKLGEVAAGMDALGHVTVWDRLFALTSPRPRAMFGGSGVHAPLPRGARPHIMAALGGIDIALWDLKGKAANLPVYALLGGERRPLQTYATGGYYADAEPLEAAAEEMARYVAAGYRAVKLKTGGYSMEEEVRRVAAVREAIGKDVTLMLDLNAAYDVNDCIRFAHAVAPYGVTWLEEPLHWYLQPRDYLRLAQASSIPLAHGERELHRYTVRDFIESGAIRYLQFDGTRSGGFTEALRVAQLAEQHGIFVAPHRAPEIHGHLVVAQPRVGCYVESHGSAERDPLWHHLYAERAQFRDGHIHLNGKPGWGVEIDWEAVRRFRAE
jgi:L-alanine-DL-glutamate epimerase-like enolase superfamily enzyme